MALCPPPAGRFGPRRLVRPAAGMAVAHGTPFLRPAAGSGPFPTVRRAGGLATKNCATPLSASCEFFLGQLPRPRLHLLPPLPRFSLLGCVSRCLDAAPAASRVSLPGSLARRPRAAPAAPPLLPSRLPLPLPRRRPRRSPASPSPAPSPAASTPPPPRPASPSPAPSSHPAPSLLPAGGLLSLLGGLDRPKKLLPKIQPLPLGLPGPRCDLHASSSFCPPHPLDIFTGISNNDCNSWNVKSTITEPRNLCPVLYTDFHNFQGILLRILVISAKSTKRRAWGCRNYTKRSRLCAASMGPT